MTDYAGGTSFNINPGNTVDGSTSTFGQDDGPGFIDHLFDVNNSPGTNFGTITKVEIRTYGDEGTDITLLGMVPYYDGTTEGAITLDMKGHLSSAQWSSYLDITNDSEGPGTGNWTWTDIQNLAIFITGSIDGFLGLAWFRLYKAEIRVTFT